jgi:phosphoadenosine phosphosulfate reductase
VRVVTLDTGRLPDETHRMIEAVRERYGVEVEVFYPDTRRVQEMVRRGGPNLFYRGTAERQECCRVRKVEPMERALGTVDAWVTGLRRDQTPERADTPKVAEDRRFGVGRPRPLWKIAPLADWSAEKVWDYTQTHDVPRHPLYDKGYTSIGCAPCTRPPRPGAGERDGRWWWESEAPRECGLHILRDGGR